MEQSIDLARFDRAKPFYPLIFNYLTFYLGYKSMMERSIALSARENYAELFRRVTLTLRSVSIDVMPCREPSPVELGVWATPEWREKFNSLEPGPFYAEAVASPRFEFPFPLRLWSEVIDGSYVIDADELARLHLKDRRQTARNLNRSAGSLLILAYESTKPHHDKGPLWEFLRHCRHAAAHNGRFTFKNGEPRREARWRQFEIVDRMEGMPLIDALEGRSLMSPPKDGFLGPGDPILLLWDIEQAYPGIVADTR